MDLLLYTPNNRALPAPAFLGLNFYGNHSIHRDPGITLSTQWMRANEGQAVAGNRATEASRGLGARTWPLERILARGYALATAYYGDLDPDFDDGFHNGVHALYPVAAGGQRMGDAWGAVGAWAWGLSRAMDYLDRPRRSACSCGGYRALSLGQGGAVGRGSGRALFSRHLDTIRVLRGGAIATALR